MAIARALNDDTLVFRINRDLVANKANEPLVAGLPDRYYLWMVAVAAIEQASTNKSMGSVENILNSLSTYIDFKKEQKPYGRPVTVDNLKDYWQL